MEGSAIMGTVAGPCQSSIVHRLHRKAGSFNIFRGVDRGRLQQLFQMSGDQHAEQRAQLVWDLGNGAELVQALGRLQTRTCKNKLRTRGSRCALGSKWLHSFSDLRIEEQLAASQDGDEDGKDPERNCSTSCELRGQTFRTCSTADGHSEPEMLHTSIVGTLKQKTTASHKCRQSSERKPEQYLHCIFH